MKRLLAFVLILCMLPSLSLAASKATLPDFKSFSRNQLELMETEKKDYLTMEKFSGSQSLIISLAKAYVELLTSKYDLDMIANFQIDYGSYDRVNYALVYDGSASMGSFNIFSDEHNWRCENCQVFLQYNIVSSGNATLWVYFRPEFNYKDTGDRYDGSSNSNAKATPKPGKKTTAAPTSRPSTTSRCTTCGGDGQVERSCSSCGGDGKRDCMSCAGKGYNNCSGCYGSGKRRCGSCYGTGKNGSKRCSICSGRGYKDCSSCSGGKQRCSACSGSGDRNCSSCSGRGTKSSTCTSCGGDGRR